jgi:chorismate mutase
MTVLKPDTSLEDIRREIDAIDDALLDLVIRRFAATAKVRATKQNDGTIAASPLRPAREASMLRRLIARADGKISPELLVRLWRVILSTSTQSQAPVVLHIDAELAVGYRSPGEARRTFLRHGGGGASGLPGHFGVLGHSPGRSHHHQDYCSVGGAFSCHRKEWRPADRIASGDRCAEAFPELLVFGHADPLPSGEDDTILISRGKVASGARWHVHSGVWTVACLPGFLTDDQAIAASHGCGETLIAGRYPRSIEVTS